MSIDGNSTSEERLARMRLARTPRVGPKTFTELLRIYGNAMTAIDNLAAASVKGGGKKPLQAVSGDVVRKEERALEKIGGRFVVFGDERYPPELMHIDSPPILLSYIGDTTLLSKTQSRIAIVGARNASANGLRFTAHLAEKLTAEGHAVVSGLARGVDGAAHEAALAAGGGTIAVVAGGVDHVYPPEHRDLYKRMTEKGGVMAEASLGAKPLRESFIRRNRIISGLSCVVVVTEAGKRSGSLATARFAGEQNRELCSVPGSPLDPRCEGTNHLLKHGAHPVTCVQDVLEALPKTHEMREAPAATFNQRTQAPIDENEMTEARNVIVNLLGAAPEDVDDLAARAGVSSRIASVIILEMELAGRIERHRGNRVSIIF